jgi:hypothetical protein
MGPPLRPVHAQAVQALAPMLPSERGPAVLLVDISGIKSTRLRRVILIQSALAVPVAQPDQQPQPEVPGPQEI